MFTKQELLKIDKNFIYHKSLHLPEQVWLGYHKCKIQNFCKKTYKSKIDRVVICGMGGSAIGGYIAQAAFGEKLTIQIANDFSTPFIDEKTLLIFCSFSGNTDETICCFKTSAKKTKNIAIITTGGRLLDLAKNSYPYVKIEKDKHPPRTSIAYQFFAIVRLLETLGLIQNQKKVVQRLTWQLSCKANALCYKSENNLADISAKKIVGKIPVIYSTSPQLFPAAYRLKCQFNENANYPAFALTLPEALHNDIQSFGSPLQEKMLPIIFSSFVEEKNSELQRDKILSLIGKRDFLEFSAEGETTIERIFSLVYLGDMISYYLAIALKTDPTPIGLIEKSKLFDRSI